MFESTRPLSVVLSPAAERSRLGVEEEAVAAGEVWEVGNEVRWGLGDTGVAVLSPRAARAQEEAQWCQGSRSSSVNDPFPPLQIRSCLGDLC